MTEQRCPIQVAGHRTGSPDPTAPTAPTAPTVLTAPALTQTGWRLVANLLTLGVFGIGLGVATHPQNLLWAAVAFALAGVLDGLDGYCARRAGGPTRLGAWLDLVGDWTAFAVAPAAVVMARWPGLSWLALTQGIFLVAAMARLIRSNFLLPRGHTGYVGLPMPAAGGGLLALGLTVPSAALVALGTLVLSGLAVSRRHYPALPMLLRRMGGRSKDGHAKSDVTGESAATAKSAGTGETTGAAESARTGESAPKADSAGTSNSAATSDSNLFADSRTSGHRVSSDLARAPGPSVPWLLRSLPTLVRDPIAWFAELWERHGDVVRVQVGPFCLLHLVVHPDALDPVLGARHRHFPKFILYPLFRTALGRGVLVSDGAHWRRQRRLMQPAFHGAHMEAMGADVQAVLGEQLDEWGTRHIEGGAFDVDLEMRGMAQRFILRVLCHADLVDEMEAMSRTFLRAAPWSLACRSLNVPARRAFLERLEDLDSHIEALIQARRQAPHPDGDILDRMLAAVDSRTGEGMSDRDARDEVQTLLFAGHETVAHALTWMWYAMARNPAVERRVHAEVDRVLAGRLPTVADLPQLAYLGQACFEVLRLFPPAWVGGRQVVQDEELGGYPIPAGSLLVFSAYLTHRHPAIWEDPERFDPERFHPERAAGRPASAYLPFGAGPRACIGYRLAMVEMQLVMAGVASRYRLRPLTDEPAKLEGRVVLMRPRGGLRMRLERRELALAPVVMDADVTGAEPMHATR